MTIDSPLQVPVVVFSVLVNSVTPHEFVTVGVSKSGIVWPQEIVLSTKFDKLGGKLFFSLKCTSFVTEFPQSYVAVK